MSCDPNPIFKEDRIQNQLDWLTFHRLWGQLPEPSFRSSQNASPS